MSGASTTSPGKKDSIGREWRFSSQSLLPQRLNDDVTSSDEYEIFPYYGLGSGKIFHGYESLAHWITNWPSIIIDGYSGIFWQEIRDSLSELLAEKGLKINWIFIGDYMKSAEEIAALVDPFLGGPDTLWGKKCDRILKDFFQLDRISSIQHDDQFHVTIVYGIGAALANLEQAPIVYMDLPKNEIQYRMRAGTITNLGCSKAGRSSDMYKRFYFVDWVVLNAHKKQLLSKATIFADAQRRHSLNWMMKESLIDGLNSLSKSVFRVRPWFEAGAWGGQWMKNRLRGINEDEVNYAWSFELIVPENGIVFESDGYLLELSFDFLMFADNRAILGNHAETFGDEFPIRFDFLDTWNGGNLSIQCHPSLQYIRENFGERITQDETYYILDCKENAQVYLGFKDNIDPIKFKQVLEDSKENNNVIDVEEFVQAHKASKHNLFLIPNGTIHSAGINNLVLEISATPYIYTFKMYDWLRLDLNGEPRTISIEHAFHNLNFERKGASVVNELISKPVVVEEGEDWQLIHLPTHPEHFYDVHRIEIDSVITIQTNNSCHVLMLVEGESVTIQLSEGTKKEFHFAETFVIPAAAREYTIINKREKRAKLVKAFIK